jgi:hypothetical protein
LSFPYSRICKPEMASPVIFISDSQIFSIFVWVALYPFMKSSIKFFFVIFGLATIILSGCKKEEIQHNTIPDELKEYTVFKRVIVHPEIRNTFFSRLTGKKAGAIILIRKNGLIDESFLID